MKKVAQEVLLGIAYGNIYALAQGNIYTFLDV